MKKIMILGSGGMLGHMVYSYLKDLNKYIIVDASYPEKLNENSTLLDVTKDDQLEQYILSERPDVVINCIGILIKGSQADPSSAIYLNSYLPHRIAKILRNTGGKLIHMSTDCVFSGIKGSYTEIDLRDADDVYGKSKALGEVINGIDLTLRTSIIGPELKAQGEGLLHWFLYQQGEIKGFKNVFWSGVTTLEVAKAVESAITNELTGLMHLSNAEKISKYDLLNLMKTVWHIDDVEIEASESKWSDKSLIPTVKFEFNVPSYQAMLQELSVWMQSNKELYENYYSSKVLKQK